MSSKMFYGVKNESAEWAGFHNCNYCGCPTSHSIYYKKRYYGPSIPSIQNRYLNCNNCGMKTNIDKKTEKQIKQYVEEIIVNKPQFIPSTALENEFNLNKNPLFGKTVLLLFISLYALIFIISLFRSLISLISGETDITSFLSDLIFVMAFVGVAIYFVIKIFKEIRFRIKKRNLYLYYKNNNLHNNSYMNNQYTNIN